jgi:cytochrome c5
MRRLFAYGAVSKSFDRAVLPLLPSPLAGEGARACPRSRMGEGFARSTPHRFIAWQQRVALSRKGRGRNNKHRACGANFFTAAYAGLSGLILVGTLAALVVGAASPLFAQTASALPPGEGRELVATACSQCHTLSVIMAGRDGPVGWKRHVYNMVLRGTQLTPREADTVIGYLITNFGPIAPATTASALPSGPGKELVETRCAVCHNLERVTVVKRQKRDWETVVANMYERWGMSAPDEVKVISAYLVAQFGRE